MAEGQPRRAGKVAIMAKSKQEKPTVAKRGRPPEEVPKDKADEIVEWISNGGTLREYCRQKGSPHWNTVYLWLDKDEDFAGRFARARERGAEAIAQQALEILDEFPLMVDGGENSGPRIDSGHVAWLKNRFEGRLKLLAKWFPQKYGDKVDVTSGGKAVGLAINIDLGDGAD